MTIPFAVTLTYLGFTFALTILEKLF